MCKLQHLGMNSDVFPTIMAKNHSYHDSSQFSWFLEFGPDESHYFDNHNNTLEF